MKVFVIAERHQHLMNWAKSQGFTRDDVVKKFIRLGEKAHERVVMLPRESRFVVITWPYGNNSALEREIKARNLTRLSQNTNDWPLDTFE